MFTTGGRILIRLRLSRVYVIKKVIIPFPIFYEKNVKEGRI